MSVCEKNAKTLVYPREFTNFLMAMSRKMLEHKVKKGESWKNPLQVSTIFLRDKLQEEMQEYLDSGESHELLDVANCCAMLWLRANPQDLILNSIEWVRLEDHRRELENFKVQVLADTQQETDEKNLEIDRLNLINKQNLESTTKVIKRVTEELKKLKREHYELKQKLRELQPAINRVVCILRNFAALCKGIDGIEGSDFKDLNNLAMQLDNFEGLLKK